MKLLKIKPLLILACLCFHLSAPPRLKAENYRYVAHELSKIVRQENTFFTAFSTTAVMALAGGAMLIVCPPAAIPLFAGAGLVGFAAKGIRTHDAKPYYQMARIMEHVTNKSKKKKAKKNEKEFLTFFESLENQGPWHGNSEEFSAFIQQMRNDGHFDRHPTPEHLRFILNTGLIWQHQKKAFHRDLTELTLAFLALKKDKANHVRTLHDNPSLFRKLDLGLLLYHDLVNIAEFSKTFTDPLSFISFLDKQHNFDVCDTQTETIAAIQNFYQKALDPVGVCLCEQNAQRLELLEFEMKALESLSKKIIESTKQLRSSEITASTFSYFTAFSRHVNDENFATINATHLDECPICMDAITLGFVACNGCKKEFCAPCIERHLSSVESCPLCRHPFRDKHGMVTGMTSHRYLIPQQLREIIGEI